MFIKKEQLRTIKWELEQWASYEQGTIKDC